MGGGGVVSSFRLAAALCMPALPLAEPTSNVSSRPAGGAISGMEPTVDTVMMQPLPAFWYYVLAGGGALLLLATVTAAMVLCCHRFHWATQKSGGGHHHSVMYHSSQQPCGHGQESSLQNQNLHWNVTQNQLHSGPGPHTEPMLTLEKGDSFDSRC